MPFHVVLGNLAQVFEGILGQLGLVVLGGLECLLDMGLSKCRFFSLFQKVCI
jgi:hypothetical protein